MAVEALTIVNGPLAGVGDEGVVSRVSQNLRAHGISPTHLGVGAVVGALMSRRGPVAGAVVGAVIVLAAEGLWHQIR